MLMSTNTFSKCCARAQPRPDGVVAACCDGTLVFDLNGTFAESKLSVILTGPTQHGEGSQFTSAAREHEDTRLDADVAASTSTRRHPMTFLGHFSTTPSGHIVRWYGAFVGADGVLGTSC